MDVRVNEVRNAVKTREIISRQLLSELLKAKIDFFLSVPCKYLDFLIRLLEAGGDFFYSPAIREEEAIGIATGAYLGGKRPAIVMQNSGFGNSVNAIASLSNYYQIPIVFVVSHRGTAGETIKAQEPMGTVTEPLLKLLKIEVVVINTTDEIKGINSVISKTLASGRSIALLLPISLWR